MKILILFLLIASPLFGQGAHRIGQVIVKGNGLAANISPYAKIKVCTVGNQCSVIQPVYSDAALTHILSQPVVADASGNYGYYISPMCIDEQISAPGQGTFLVLNICPSTGAVGSGSVSSVSVVTLNGFQGSVANATTTPAITLSPDASHYFPTITDETNWNAKQAALGFTPENIANKDAVSGYAGLTSGSLLKPVEFPAFSGDATSPSGTTVLTLATVNNNVGPCGDATHVSQITLNAKGLGTSCNPITAQTYVSTISVGNLSPLFTSAVSSPTSSPAVTFNLSPVAINTVYAGPPTGSPGAPSFQSSPTISAANMTNFPSNLLTLGGILGPDNGALSAGAGTGATFVLTGSDATHQLQINAGTGPTTSDAVLTVTFTTSRGHAPNCTLSPSSLTASALGTTIYINASTSSTSYQLRSGTTGLSSSTVYIWNVNCP